MFFYLPDIKSRADSESSEDFYEGDLIQHFISLRVTREDLVWITDLNGFLLKAEILDVNKAKKQIRYSVIESKTISRPKPNILFQAIMDMKYLEKLFEILPHSGFSKIVLFASENSPKYGLRLERLEKILVRSCSQAQILYKPQVEVKTDLENIQDCINTTSQENQKFALLDFAGKQILNQPEVANEFDYSGVIVGPEGGFSSQEVALLGASKNVFKVAMGEIIYPGWLAGYSFNKLLKKL